METAYQMALKYAIKSGNQTVNSSSFTSQKLVEKEEIRLKLHLENDAFPTVEIALHRLDGSNCLAVVDGKSVSLVSRSSVMTLVEAVQTIGLR